MKQIKSKILRFLQSACSPSFPYLPSSRPYRKLPQSITRLSWSTESAGRPLTSRESKRTWHPKAGQEMRCTPLIFWTKPETTDTMHRDCPIT